MNLRYIVLHFVLRIINLILDGSNMYPRINFFFKHVTPLSHIYCVCFYVHKKFVGVSLIDNGLKECIYVKVNEKLTPTTRLTHPKLT